MNQYETVFILTPVLTEEMVAEAVGKFRQVLEVNGAELVHQESWGLKQMAYTIRKKSSGFYHLFEFKGDAGLVDKLELEFRRDERVLRFLTVSLDKHAVLYNQSRRNPDRKSKSKQTQPEPAHDQQ
jgi:small subunit ribosomal protein S6